MTVSRLMMPAVTLAGALALAGCGGGGGAGLSPAEIAANEAADAAATATNGAVDAAFALDLTADDAGDKVSAAAGLITAARTAVGRLTEGQSGQADGLTARLSQANQFVTLAGELLAQKAKAAMEAKEAADDLKMAMDNAEQAARDAKEAAETAAARAAMAQETAVTEAEAEVRREAAAEAERVKQAADALLEAEKAKVTAAQNELDTANSRITALQGEIRTLNNQITEAKNTEEAERTAEATAEAKAAATAVFHAIRSDSSDAYNDAATSIPNTYADFKKAKGEKHHQKITVQGHMFEKVPGIGTATAEVDAAAGDPEGAYDIMDAGVSNSLSRDEATSAAFAPGPSQKEHEVPENQVAFTTSGEWMGVSGTFYCAMNCTSRNGHPEGNNWRFKPGDPKSRVTGADVVWGWWAALDSNDELNHFEVFTHQGGAPAQGDSSSIESGSATFEGDATGKYAIRAEESGDFTAKATLTAKFGATTDTLSGEITNFKDGDGNDKTGWSVSLEENNLDSTNAALNSAAVINNTAKGLRRATVWTRDGVKGDEEWDAWDADLYGGSENEVPSHILGTFEAKHDGARMIGAFGTKKTGESAE